jgi:GT2 family glycosyltransferase
VTLLDHAKPPVGLLDIELSDPLPCWPAGESCSSAESVLAFVRLHTHPLGAAILQVRPEGLTDRDVADAVYGQLGPRIATHLEQDRAGTGQADSNLPPCLHRRARVLAAAPSITVIVATRDRTVSLYRCLQSVLELDYPAYEVVVVDNAPSTDATAQLVRTRFAHRGVRYVCESRPGLGAAHNRGIEAATGQILAFTDDDVVVDRHWLAAVAEAFALTTDVGAVTGLIQPAELRTSAQLLLERLGSFGKGFETKVFDRYTNRPPDWRFPLAAGQMGSGANMAFEGDCLRSLGGFEPALGAGTRSRGGDDLGAFFRVVASGHRLVYQPAAVVRHWGQDSDAAVIRQAYGYGVGLGAYLADSVVRHPAAVLRTLLQAPGAWARRGEAKAYTCARRQAGIPPNLARLRRRAMIIGPFAYAASRWRTRDAIRPVLP